MRYVMLICDDEAAQLARSAEDTMAVIAEYGKFGEEMGRRGVIVDSARLRPTTEATTVTAQNGKVLASDGPFAETKEQIGGFYLIDCKDSDEAIEIASKIPTARKGKIEVRPVWEMGG